MTATADVRSTYNSLLVSSEGQTFLVGHEVYLRPPAPADAEYAQSWKFAKFPISPDRIRALIDDGKTGDDSKKGRPQLLIVRKSDDRPVGSISIDYRWFPHHEVVAHVDPLYETHGVEWKAEALAMVLPWLVDEQQRPKAGIHVPTSETAVIKALEAVGARSTTRFREKLAAPEGGRRDELIMEYLNRDWMTRLGDPSQIVFPRTGIGVPRPVTAPATPNADPPDNAVRLGPRVYLRPPQQSDAKALAYWSARETDINWDNGREAFGSEGAKRWLESTQKQTPPHTIDFAVCLRDTDEFIGMVGVLDVDYRHRSGESASMILNPSYREAGYGSEAKHLLFDYVFNTVGLHALQSYVMFENPRSAAALRKQGYRDAGRKHWTSWRNGSFVSYVTFDLLADDWRAMPRRASEESST